MLRLTLLGGLRLEDADGPVVGRAAQRLRLALLALLSSPPGEPVPRDRLTAYLWPEKSDARARSSLSTALYDVRREFGESTIRTHGDDVSLDPQVIGSDVAEFTAALDAGDVEAAIECYAGPFLDGFFLSGAPDFEQWVDRERQRYERAYRDALEQLAERRAAVGDARGAAEAWRQIAVLDPFASRTALGYMAALEAAGDRATALQFARVHASLLEQELGTTPDPAVTALEDRLRRAPQPPAPAEPPEPAAPAAPAAPVGPAAQEQDPTSESVQPSADVGPRPRDVSAAGSPEPQEPSPPGLPGHQRHPGRWMNGRRVGVALAATVLILVFLALAIMPRGPGVDPSMAGTEPVIGVAVLPFANLTGDPAEEHIAAGLTEDILNALARIDRFRVPGVTSIAALEGLNLDLRQWGSAWASSTRSRGAFAGKETRSG